MADHQRRQRTLPRHVEQTVKAAFDVDVDVKSAFMVFWKLLNDIQRDLRQPELTYGDARDWWKEFLNRMGV